MHANDSMVIIYKTWNEKTIYYERKSLIGLKFKLCGMFEIVYSQQEVLTLHINNIDYFLQHSRYSILLRLHLKM